MTPRRLGIPALATALVAAAAPCAFAAADPGSAKQADFCVAPQFSKPFAPWKDRHNYTPVPNGGLESGAMGWLLGGKASVAGGARPYGTGTHVLALGSGASATTPPVCVGLHYPFFRFFARHDGSSRSRLRVEVLYLGADGKLNTRETSRLRQARGKWLPSRRFSLPKGLVANAGKGKLAPVAFRFTPVGAKATWTIDDVFVDPYLRG